MENEQGATQSVDIADIRHHLDEFLIRVAQRKTRVLVERQGSPVAAIVSPEGLRRLDRLDAERAERFTVIDELRAAFRDVPPEEFAREAARPRRGPE